MLLHHHLFLYYNLALYLLKLSAWRICSFNRESSSSASVNWSRGFFTFIGISSFPMSGCINPSPGYFKISAVDLRAKVVSVAHNRCYCGTSGSHKAIKYQFSGLAGNLDQPGQKFRIFNGRMVNLVFFLPNGIDRKSVV